MTRLETFVDAAFAFSVTLLVISIDSIPSSYGEFVSALKSIPAFVASFFQMIMFWLGHRAWSRRFGLEDSISVWLSLALVAGILIIVYPLRVIFAAGFAQLTDGWLLAVAFEFTLPQIGAIFLVYGIGFFALSGLVAGLFLRAYTLRDALGLDDLERHHTRWDVGAWSILAGTGLVSSAWAWLASGEMVIVAGWIYAVLGVLMPWHAYARIKRAPQGVASSLAAP